MTDEQIKQNAEAYAIENYGKYDEHDYTDHSGSNMCHAVSEKAFIAGAHSRDEEINNWKEYYEELAEIANDLQTERQTLMIKNAKISNPWISVEKQLPEIEDEKEERTGEVFVCIKNGVYLVAHYSYFYKAWYAFDDRGECMYRKIKTPLYWMPIPQIEKGE